MEVQERAMMVGLSPEASRKTWYRFWPELLLFVASAVILLGSLDSPELWGKREQRAAAETIDTIEGQRWLVAEIQGRPRLEKPPLPRWIVAALMLLTGRRTEAVLRLPSALSGLATLALVYSLGAKIGGRRLALAATAALCTTGIFISEHRQAGNDGMLGLFTTLALHAAWGLIHRSGPLPGSDSLPLSSACPTDRRLGMLVFTTATGFGFLCKGPIVLMLVGATVFPYLVCTRRLRSHGPRFLGLRAWLVFLVLALCWPVSVLVHDHHALGVWLTEMGQKTGALPIGHREREILGLLFPILALPWSVLALAAVFLPIVNHRRVKLPWQAADVWFPWWWSIGNLVIFSCWSVAKPNYYLPCLPGLAILLAMTWLRLCETARDLVHRTPARLALFLLGLQWLLLIVSGILVPLIGRRQFETAPWVVLTIIAGAIWSSAFLGAMLWRRGKHAFVPLPIVVACAAGVLLGYGLIAPLDDPVRGHARLASRLERLVPFDSKSLHFFHEIDEGLWYYFRGPRLRPVPGSQPRYSDSYDKVRTLIRSRSELASSGVRQISILDPRKQNLLRWLRQVGKTEGYLIMRAAVYDLLTADLEGLVIPIHREHDLKRNALVLLQVVNGPGPVSGLDSSLRDSMTP